MREEKKFISLPLLLRRRMLRHVRSVLPEEGCGFVAGIRMQAVAVLPVANRLHSSFRFVMEPVEQWKAMQWIDQNDLEIIAIYHSHPSGPVTPSVTDLAEHSFPEAYSIICSPSGLRWRLRGFKISPAGFEELSIVTGVKNVVPGE